MINYLLDKFFYSINYEIQKDYQIKKQRIILLGDGFFARGFLHYIDRNRFHITQIYKDEFINPQDIMYSLQRNKYYQKAFHLRDYLTKPSDIIIKTNITDLDITTKNKVKINI